jgi:hypothetical protein
MFIKENLKIILQEERQRYEFFRKQNKRVIRVFTALDEKNGF